MRSDNRDKVVQQAYLQPKLAANLGLTPNSNKKASSQKRAGAGGPKAAYTQDGVIVGNNNASDFNRQANLSAYSNSNPN